MVYLAFGGYVFSISFSSISAVCFFSCLSLFACSGGDVGSKDDAGADTVGETSPAVTLPASQDVPGTNSGSIIPINDGSDNPSVSFVGNGGECEADVGCDSGKTCVNGSCLLACAAGQQVCGQGSGAAVCCGDGQICHLESCINPGAACDELTFCDAGQYCDTLLSKCLPKAPVLPGQAECRLELSPSTDIEMIEEGTWSGDPNVRSDSVQVMMAPVVANLDDDNGDGKIDQHDIPDIIFTSFQGINYRYDGTLRAISGKTMKRLPSWPSSDPGYWVSPGASVAVADIDKTSPGPEIVACEAEGISGGRSVLLISSNGSILKRYDGSNSGVGASFSVQCESDSRYQFAPVVGNMDNDSDGIVEIGVQGKVFNQNGLLFEVDDNVFPTMVDITDDGFLEYVTSRGVYDYHGCKIHEGESYSASTGTCIGGSYDATKFPSAIQNGKYVAVADMLSEFPGPEIVIVTSGGSHPSCAGFSMAGRVSIVETQTWSVVHSFSVNPPAVSSSTRAALDALIPAGTSCTAWGTTGGNIDDYIDDQAKLCEPYIRAADARDSARGEGRYASNAAPCTYTGKDSAGNNVTLTQSGSAKPAGGGPPTIGNFDDDPEPEIAFAGAFSYTVYNSDGTELWSIFTQDRSSRATGSSLFDFDGDGRTEVLYNDEVYFRVLDGQTGKVLREEENSSGTLWEYPLVVDVDNDGQTEIVFIRNNYNHHGGKHGIVVKGNDKGQWVRTRRIWNQHTYHVTNINEDGTVPFGDARKTHWKQDPNAEDPWHLNTFRKNIDPFGLFDLPDLVAEGGIANADTDGDINLRVDVVNRGSAAARRDTPVSFFQVKDDGSLTHLADSMIVRDLYPGVSEAVTVSVAGIELTGVIKFVAHINHPDNPGSAFNESLHECRIDNNRSAEFQILSSGNSETTGFTTGATTGGFR